MSKRMEAAMPEVERNFFFRPKVVASVLIILTYSAIVSWALIGIRTPKIAVPMNGKCEDGNLRSYSAQDKDGKTCTWRDLQYWCLLDPNKNEWSCNFINPQPSKPVEKPNNTTR
jgi:hypothetical protein